LFGKRTVNEWRREYPQVCSFIRWIFVDRYLASRLWRVVYVCSAVILAVLAMIALVQGLARTQSAVTLPNLARLDSNAPLPPGTFAGPCRPWIPVNDGAFGIPSNYDSNGNPIEPPPEKPYDSEEGFEVLVFKGQLYVGMEADNKFGARLWRTRAGVVVPYTQTQWEEVAEVNGEPFGNAQRQNGMRQNDHIDSLAEFNGVLYASTANGGSSEQGTLIYSSTTGAASSWTQAITSGFGYTQNTNFKDMQVFQGWLCGGTQNWMTGAQVWCTNHGISWTQKAYGGFGATGNDTTTVEIWSGYVYSSALYFGAQNTGAIYTSTADDVALLLRTADLSPMYPDWMRVYTGAAGSYRVDILGDLDGYLYIATTSVSGVVILRSATGDAGTWSQVNVSGMDGNAQNSSTVVDGAAVYNGALYVAVTNVYSGVTVWRTTGVENGGLVDWTRVGGHGLDNGKNYYAELIPFNGYLYAWTSNYYTGQQVLRTACPICQAREITGTGLFDFDGVGAALSLTVESLNVVTICVYPGAFPTAQMTGMLPVPRRYEITHTPAGGAFTGDLILAYTDAEFDASDIHDENTTYLVRWAGSAWQACPNDKRARNVSANTVTCRDMTNFSDWAIAGESGAPAELTVLRFVSRRQAFDALLLSVMLIGVGCGIAALIFVMRRRRD